jgi:hypothetical protein
MWMLLAAGAVHAGTVEGTVLNGTSGKTAGSVDVILIQLQGEMQPVATTKANASGHFTFDRPEIGQGPMLLRVTYKGINYNEMLPPGRASVDVKIYEPTDKASTVSISTHAIVLRPNGDQLMVGEEYGVENQTQPPVSYFKADGTFQFNLPPDGRIHEVSAWSAAGMPVTQGTIDKGKNREAIAFAFKPGENGVRVSYNMPYAGNQVVLHAQSPYAAQRVLIAAPPTMQISAPGFAPAGNEQGFALYTRDAVGADTNLDISVSGTAPPPEANRTVSGPPPAGAGGAGDGQDQTGSDAPAATVTSLPARLDDMKWILVGGFALLFAMGGAFLWRRPQVAVPQPAGGGYVGGPSVPTAAATLPAAVTGSANAATAAVRDSSSEIMAAVAQQARLSLDELKDQMFRLELRRQAGTISESDYTRQRDQFETTLRELVRG